MTEEKNAEECKNLCDGCTKCCDHITIELDEPEDLDDINEIMWFVLHKDVLVFIDDEGEWHVQFNTDCTSMDEKGNCQVYDERPTICADYGHDECEKYGDGEYYRHMFNNREEFKRYIEVTPKLKKILEGKDSDDKKEG